MDPPSVAEEDGENLIISPGEEDRTAVLHHPTLDGFELRSYLFLGNCLQIIGLKTVPADRAAFIV